MIKPREKYQRPEKPERPVRSEFQPTHEMRELIFKRTAGFLCDDRPLRIILAECYLQGMRDTIDAQNRRIG